MNSVSRILIIIIIFALGTLFVAGGTLINFGKFNYPEAEYLKSHQNLTFEEIQNYFKNLALKKGAEYAFNVLKVAELPPNTDIHLLGHTVGDILYKQQGMNGIKICTQDFRNACSHSIVIGLFIDRGLGALSDIANVCRNAPGGSGAYGMCFHGLGHGILAYANYDLAKGVELCKAVGTPERNYTETSECIGGMIMEMISGVHDPVSWAKQKDKYFKASDPLYPCDSDLIPDVGKANCYTYLTPHLWQVAGADINNPDEKYFAKSISFCSVLSGQNAMYREFCYGGFGKEFVAMAESRDIRQTQDMGPDQLAKIYKWCLMSNDTYGTNACIRSAVNSLYWGGENKPNAAVTFCKVMDNQNFQKICFEHVIGSFRYYQPRSKLFGLCKLLPSPYNKECRDPNFNEVIQ